MSHMNHGYTQSNVNEKKHEMAEKMLHFGMHGRKVAKGGRGMIPKQNGTGTKHSGGESVDMHGGGSAKGHGEKPVQSNPKARFSHGYSQNGKA